MFGLFAIYLNPRNDLQEIKMKIGVIGEFKKDSETHYKLNEALKHVEALIPETIDISWVDTEAVISEKGKIVRNFDGIWSAPGSPFKSLEGSLLAIRIAREENIPHLGTCAGFQHTIIEIARNILGVEYAQHEEHAPDSSALFISRLACSLAGKKLRINLEKGTLAEEAYGAGSVEENYYCNFAVNPDFKEKLKIKEITWSGIDDEGEWRILELPENDFFISTLFVPQTRSPPENPHPLIKKFIQAAQNRIS